MRITNLIVLVMRSEGQEDKVEGRRLRLSINREVFAVAFPRFPPVLHHLSKMIHLGS